MSALPPRSVPDLLRRLLGADPGRPRITWYAPGGERVELSTRTLDNWVAKSANLLAEEFEVGPGSRVDVRLPVHWRTATWLLAAWVTGACVVVAQDGAAPAVGPAPDSVITADPAAAVAAGLDPATIVAVALPALATTFGPGLPPGALDGTAEVRTRGDVFAPPAGPDAGDAALVVAAGAVLTHGDLLAEAREAARAQGLGAGARVLTRAGAADAVRGLLAPLAIDGSVVLCSPALADAELVQVAEQERVTHRS